jgi:sec-independent protein translocase protein TatB
MFDITSSKLLILFMVALLVIGPKDLPALLRTIGKYMGIIKRQAAEFRAQFDDAMRESELSDLKKQVETLGTEAEAQIRAAENTVEQQIAEANRSVDVALEAPAIPPPDDLPVASSDGAAGVQAPATSPLNGAASHADEPAAVADTPAEPGRAPEKSGA